LALVPNCLSNETIAGRSVTERTVETHAGEVFIKEGRLSSVAAKYWSHPGLIRLDRRDLRSRKPKFTPGASCGTVGQTVTS
jgi:hypothetical protein